MRTMTCPSRSACRERNSCASELLPATVEASTSLVKRSDSVVSTLAASNGKRNASVWRSSVRLSLFSNLNRARGVFFLTLIGREAHTQCDSPGGSTRRGRRTFPFQYYEDGHTCSLCKLQR